MASEFDLAVDGVEHLRRAPEMPDIKKGQPILALFALVKLRSSDEK
jgi:hypothetical protein